ncbi:MAG: ABC transporter permease [Chloroflexi bacterium]|nr:ABC transporter permease [Chloroflexota bacterium]
MIKTRVRKILRDVWARKGRTALVSIAILIGVTGTIALFSMSTIIVGQLEEDINQEDLPMVQIFVGPNADVPLHDATYTQIMQTSDTVPGVTEVMVGFEDSPFPFKVEPDDERFEDGLLQASAIWNGDTENPALISVFGDEPTEEYAAAPLEPARLLEGQGRFPQTGQNELAIEKRMADEYGLEVGDPLYVRVLSPTPLNPEKVIEEGVEEWTITGIIFDAYGFEPSLSVYPTYSDAQYILNLDGFASVTARFDTFETAEDEFEEFQNLVATLGTAENELRGIAEEPSTQPYAVGFSLLEDPAQNTLIVQAQQIGDLMGALALMSLIVSGFLVINVINSLVVEQKRQIGVMKSMGATRGDNFFMYSGIAFTYGLLGVIPGIIFGILGGNAAANALAPELNTLLEGFNYSIPSVLLGAIVGLLVPVVASLIPVFNGTRVQILEAMTDLGIDANYGSGPIAKGIGALPVPVTIRQGFSNVSLKKGRLAFTVLTLSVAAGTFMGIWAIFETFTDGIALFIDNYNVQIGVAPADARDPAEFKAILEDNFQTEERDYIETLEPLMNLQVEFEGYDPEVSPFGPPGIFAYGYDVESETPGFNFTIDQGEPLMPETKDDGIIFSSALANHMDVGLNDEVILKVPGRTRELTIVGISEIPLDQVWLHWEVLAEVAGYSYDVIVEDDPDYPLPPDSAVLTQLLSITPLGGFVKYDSRLDAQTGDDAIEVQAIGMTPAITEILAIDEGGRFPEPDSNEIIISREMADARPDGSFTFADDPDAAGPEYYTLTLASRNGQEETYTIVGVFELPGIDQSMAAPSDDAALEGETPVPELDPEVMQSLMTMPDETVGFYWQDLTTLDNVLVNSTPRPQFWSIITPLDDPSADELEDMLDDMEYVLSDQNISLFGLNFVELTDQISQGFAIIQSILSAVAGLIAVVGALGLLTTLSMSVFERQKEIGVMRSIGAGSLTIVFQFLTEGLVVGFIAWIVGIPLMIVIQFVLLEVIQARDLFPVEFSPTATLIGLIGMIVITAIASLWPSVSASRKTVSDILRYQ